MTHDIYYANCQSILFLHSEHIILGITFKIKETNEVSHTART